MEMTGKAGYRAFYGSYFDEMVAAMESLELMVSDLELDLLRSRGRSPIEYIKTRLKSPESMQEKLSRLQAQGIPVSRFTDLYDGVGIRLVTTFIDDVYAVIEWIREWPDLRIVQEKDYVHRPKASGYRSYHLQVEVRIEHDRWVNAEIQVRTIAMDCWASLEHQLRYKKHLLKADMMASELKRCADEMASTDINLMTIRDRIEYEPEGGPR